MMEYTARARAKVGKLTPPLRLSRHYRKSSKISSDITNIKMMKG